MGYYTANFNHPQASTGVPGTNTLYNFNVQANQLSLNMAKLTMSHDPDPVGFRVDLGFGKAFDIIHGSEPSGSTGFLRNIEQVYVSVKSKKGLQADFGQFVSSAGAEVIETKDNWNYSRALLFAWAVPYYHFGLRTTLPVGSHFTGGVQVVNGWNNVEDNNSGKTLGFIGNFTSKKAVTAEAKATQGVLARLEYRRDWSDQNFFQKGPTGATDHQDTVSLGIVAFFGPKR